MSNGYIPAPSNGLGSNSNYILHNNCNNIDGLVVTIDITQDIVCTANSNALQGQTQEYGFGFQLNAYSPKNEKSAWQQYVISLFEAQLNSVVNNWPTSGNYIINNYTALTTVPKLKMPAGYTLVISLLNDASSNITGATYEVITRGVAPALSSVLTGYWETDNSQHVNFIGTDGHIHELYIHPGAGWVNNDLTAFSGGSVVPESRLALHGYWGSNSSQHVNFIGTDGHVRELYIHPGAPWVNNDLTNVLQAHVTQTLTSISGVNSADLAPIVAFELNLVGPSGSESATLSSGAGSITYKASSPLTVLSAEPSCTESGYVTAETANSVYGELPTGSQTSFTQSFSITNPAAMISKTGTLRHLLITPGKAEAAGLQLVFA